MSKRQCTRKRTIFKKGKEKIKEEKEDLNFFRKIRISWSDPYATDSSDDEGYRSLKNDRVRRVVKEVLIMKSSSDGVSMKGFLRSDGENENGKITNTLYRRTDNRKTCGTSSEYKGVTCKKSGKFSAQIHDPIRGVRLWLGTYDTELEAANAFSRKKDEFNQILEARQRSSALHCDQGIKEGKGNVDMVKNAEEQVHEAEESVLYLLEEPVAPSLDY